jgi:hypothetical protein
VVELLGFMLLVLLLAVGGLYLWFVDSMPLVSRDRRIGAGGPAINWRTGLDTDEPEGDVAGGAHGQTDWPRVRRAAASTASALFSFAVIWLIPALFIHAFIFGRAVTESGTDFWASIAIAGLPAAAYAAIGTSRALRQARMSQLWLIYLGAPFYGWAMLLYVPWRLARRPRIETADDAHGDLEQKHGKPRA